MNARAVKFVRFDKAEDHLRQGWMVMVPNALMHHHHYGIEMKWICPCKVPGGFRVSNRVHITPTESANGSEHRA